MLYFQLLPVDLRQYIYQEYLAKPLGLLWQALAIVTKLPGPATYESAMYYCIEYGYLAIIKWLWRQHKIAPADISLKVAEFGHVHILQWIESDECNEIRAMERKTIMSGDFLLIMRRKTAANGRIAMLEFLTPKYTKTLCLDDGCRILKQAIAYKQIKTVKWLLAHNYAFPDRYKYNIERRLDTIEQHLRIHYGCKLDFSQHGQ